MDVTIPEDISYLNFLNEKNTSYLLQNNGLEIQEVDSLTDEPMLTEFEDGNSAWTINGVPVYLNTLAEAEDQETDENVLTKTVENPVETTEYPLDISKGFLTSSGLFLSSDVLLQLNLQNDQIKTDVVTQTNVAKSEEEVNSDALKSSVDDLIEVVSMHRCKHCSAYFESYDDIVEHVKSVCLEKVQKIIPPKVQRMSSILKTADNKNAVVKDIYLCGMCEGVGYESIDNLKKHMLTKHNLTYKGELETKTNAEEKPKSTNGLFQSIVNKQQLEGKRVKCLIKGCDSRFSKLELMMRHHSCHVDENKKKFKCPECDQIFFAWRMCRAHLWKCHKVDIGLYTCAVCNVFKSQSPHSLLVHMASHDTEKPFLCSTCGHGFKQLAQLRNHKVAVHKESIENANWIAKVSCTTCGRIFSTSKNLKKHVQAVHNKYKPFICNICGHSCARKAMLELHLRQHTGEKPYKCQICDYKTGDHNSLRRHVGRHYGVLKYSCPHCSYQCMQSTAYKMHIKRKHPGKGGVFACLICSYETVNEQMYNDHVRGHELANVPISKLQTTIGTTDAPIETSVAELKVLPSVEDEETQPGLFSSDNLEELAVDTGGITIPAGSEMQV